MHEITVSPKSNFTSCSLQGAESNGKGYDGPFPGANVAKERSTGGIGLESDDVKTVRE